MKDFVDFLLKRVYKSIPIPFTIINKAFTNTVNDVKFHFSEIEDNDIKTSIQNNSNELAIFLYRLGRELHINDMHDRKPQIHWLLKELCSCEIYFNNDIGEGFYVVHGEGTVIGSRNKIGKGFVIHQGCTIGHRKNGEGKGNVIADNVVMYSNSSIIGGINVGENAIIGAHVLLSMDLRINSIVTQKGELNMRPLKK